MDHRVAGVAVSLALAIVIAACGGSPNAPTPPGPPPPPPADPTITSITVSDDRPEIGDTIQVTATATPGNSANQLEYHWTADAGTFQGMGATVTWRAPNADETPVEYALTLEVIEKTAVQDLAVSKLVNVLVHDSDKELGNMAMRFLNNFATSSISADICVLDFYDGCEGKQTEHDQIADNRVYYTILDSTLALDDVSVHSDRTHADVRVACAFSSRIEKCKPGETCTVDSIEHVGGTCALTGVYHQDRWWLCDSHFHGVTLASVAALNSSSR